LATSAHSNGAKCHRARAHQGQARAAPRFARPLTRSARGGRDKGVGPRGVPNNKSTAPAGGVDHGAMTAKRCRPELDALTEAHYRRAKGVAIE
jgi:hypothetical protein